MDLNDLHKEINYRTSRSGGAGGQHVNKVSTKVELLFNVGNSEIITERKKTIIQEKLKNRISYEGVLSLQCDETRSQFRNKELVFERFLELIKEALTPNKIRAVFQGDAKTLELLPDDYSDGTIAHYHTLLNYLEAFLEESSMKKMRIDEWKRKHFVQFETFLLTRTNILLKRPISRATSNKYLSKLKVIFNNALANEVIVIDPTKGFKMERISGSREYLTADEILRIESNCLANNQSLDRARWIFLFSVYTGLRFSDAINLKRDSIIQESDGNYYIEIIQQKTKQALYRPLLGKAIEIYSKFMLDNPESAYVLPKISNQKVNAYLKVIADLCGIKKKLSHHIARHSFATTILLDSGVDLKATSFFMGHTSVKTTEVYAKISKNRAVDVVKMLDGNL